MFRLASPCGTYEPLSLVKIQISVAHHQSVVDPSFALPRVDGIYSDSNLPAASEGSRQLVEVYLIQIQRRRKRQYRRSSYVSDYRGVGPVAVAGHFTSRAILDSRNIV
jgi:hypothetical protein